MKAAWGRQQSLLPSLQRSAFLPRQVQLVQILRCVFLACFGTAVIEQLELCGGRIAAWMPVES